MFSLRQVEEGLTRGGYGGGAGGGQRKLKCKM